MSAFHICFGALLVLATVIMSCLALSTCVQVFRLRNKRMSWRAGTLKGFPLFATIFLAISIVLFAVFLPGGDGWNIAAAAVYVLFSLSWFVSSYYSSKRYITDHGIVKNVNDPSQTIAWHQIYDFFERELQRRVMYVFIYKRQQDTGFKKVMRLRLLVPDEHHRAFKRLLAHKLGRRINCYEDEKLDIHFFDKQ